MRIFKRKLDFDVCCGRIPRSLQIIPGIEVTWWRKKEFCDTDGFSIMAGFLFWWVQVQFNLLPEGMK